MDHIIRNGKTIDWTALPREDYITLYEESMQQSIVCPSCQTPLLFTLPVDAFPFWEHKKETGCSHGQKSKKITSQWNRSVRMEIGTSFSEHQQERLYLNDHKEFPLNSDQYEAVTYGQGPLLVLAGAGSGKTRVLTARAAHLIQSGLAQPSQLLLVTFTAKAANEMKERLQNFSFLTSQQINSIVSGTFHSIFYRILLFHEGERWNKEHLIKGDWQKEWMLKDISRKMGIDERDFAYDATISLISFWKNSMLFPDDVKPEDDFQQSARDLYREYESLKMQRQLFDFDDMLIGCYQLFKENPSILSLYQQRFHYFLIDEFQDVNAIQFELMKMLSEVHPNVTAVGDDDQSLYAFRGSDPSYILDFTTWFPGTKKVVLHENYRSSHEIVSAAQAVISKNEHRHKKRMKAQFSSQSYPFIFFPFDEEEEAVMIVEDIKRQWKSGLHPSKISVLYRTHSSCRAIFERLVQSGLPFQIEGDNESFYSKRNVKHILSFLRLSQDANDYEALETILPALYLKQSCLSEAQVYSITEKCSLLDALKHITNIKPFQKRKLEEMIPLFKTLALQTPEKAISTILVHMGYGDYVKKNGNEGNTMDRGSDFVKELQGIAKRFSTITQLLEHADHMHRYWGEARKWNNYSRKGVQLMTVHRAKGLEFERVYILGAVDGSFPHDYALEKYRTGESGPLEEERRIFYVALTRAKQDVFISVPSKLRGKRAHPSRFIRYFTGK